MRHLLFPFPSDWLGVLSPCRLDAQVPRCLAAQVTEMPSLGHGKWRVRVVSDVLHSGWQSTASGKECQSPRCHWKLAHTEVTTCGSEPA